MVSVIVAEGFPEDYAKSIGRISNQFFQKFNFLVGEKAELISKTMRIGIILRPIEEIDVSSSFPKNENYNEDEAIIHINGFLRSNLKVALGQRIPLDKTTCPNAEEIVVTPLREENREQIYIDYFFDRPIVAGQIIELQNRFGLDIKVGIHNTKPPGIVNITKETNVLILNEIPSELKDDNSIGNVMYDDIGGHSEILKRLRGLIEYPLRYPELFNQLHIDPPQGILITGPLGSGKTFISKALAYESGVTRFFVQSTEIVKGWWEIEQQMESYFNQVINFEPAILILDQIEVLAPASTQNLTDLERRLTNQLIKNLDRIKGKQIVVIGTTESAENIHPTLLIEGRLETEINIPIPNSRERLEILQVHTRGVPLDHQVSLQKIALDTGGYTPADLELLVKEAGLHALNRQDLLSIEIESDHSPEKLPNITEIELLQEDFEQALAKVKPSASREIRSHIPNVTWDDIGGLEDIKQAIKEMVEWPLTNPDIFTEMGVRSPRGILLYGPPGTGKTLLAKAVANEIQANMLVVKGPELLSKWFSESARMIRELFRRARQLAPCIIFFDEIDALASKRGGAFSAHSSGERDRVINQLLASLDGVEIMKDVIVIGATNRPEDIDPALLRPGRLDRLIYVGVPDEKTREKIFNVHTREMPLESDVKLDKLAKLTPNFSGADILMVCREAAFNILRRDMNSRVIAQEAFEQAIIQISPSITPEIQQRFRQLRDEMNNRRTKQYAISEQEFI